MKKFLVSATLTMLCFSSVLAAFPLELYRANNDCEHPFIDSIDNALEEEICFLYVQGVVEGRAERNYFPASTVTRAEFLKIALLNIGYVITSSPADSFTDTIPGDWYFSYVTFARDKGFISGYPDGSFRPNEAITRAEAVMMNAKIAEIIDYDTVITNRYSDVSQTDWFAVGVAVSSDLGIIHGYSNGTFQPYNHIRRDETAAVAERTYEQLYSP